MLYVMITVNVLLTAVTPIKDVTKLKFLAMMKINVPLIIVFLILVVPTI